MEYNFNKPSRRQLETSKRIERQTSDYLDKYYTNLKEEEERIVNEKNESIMSAARFSNASAYVRSKQRAQNMNEHIKYADRSSAIGMTEMLSQIVEESLLFDVAEYSQMNPNYKQEIRETVKGLIESGNIVQDITNRDTLTIMEYVAKNLPSIKTGMYLSEDEISAYMTRQPSIMVDAAISKLSGNVKSRVANLVEKEQQRVKKVKEEMPADEKEPEAAKDLEDLPADEAAALDQDADGDVDVLENPPAEEEVADAETAPVDGEMPATEEDLAATEEEIPVEDPVPSKQVSIKPDGTINVNVFEAREYMAFMSQLKEECNAILSDDIFYLNEEFDENKYIDKNAKKEYNRFGGTVGAVTGWLFFGIVGGIIGLFLGKTIANSKNSDKIHALKRAVEKDPEAMSIIADIKDAYKYKDTGALKSLKKQFAAKVKDIKLEIKDEKTEKISERVFFKDVPRSGLIESLAVNEAHNMIKEHGVYNRDLAFANALMYVTVLETFAATGLLNVDNVAYSTIINQAGGKAI